MLISRTPVAAEWRIDLHLPLQCQSPLLLQLQLKVTFFHLFICTVFLQLKMTKETLVNSLNLTLFFLQCNLILTPLHLQPYFLLLLLLLHSQGCQAAAMPFRWVCPVFFINLSSVSAQHNKDESGIISWYHCIMLFYSLTPTHRRLWLHLSCSLLVRSTLHKLSHAWVRVFVWVTKKPEEHCTEMVVN